MTSEWAIDLSNVTKRFGATVALDKASFRVRRGVVHALLGENGAGKSTTVKLLSGLMRPDAGSISVMGQEVVLHGPKDAHRAGVQTAFQEMTLVRDLTVAQNLLMSCEPTGWLGRIKRRESQRMAAEWLERLELNDVRPGAYIRDLALPVRQKIEIAKAIVRGPQVLLLDEPTSALSGRDVAWLSRRIDEMKANGVTFVFISHRMQEVREFCDSLTVYRNGKDVGAFDTADISDDEVIRLVIGRSLEAKYPPKVPALVRSAIPAIEARGIRVDSVVRDFNLTLKVGEVRGIAALQGMGQRELFEALFGAEFIDEGQILIDGKPVTLTSTADSLKAGVATAFLPEDRKTEGLFLRLPGGENVSLPVIKRFSRFGLIDRKREQAAIKRALAQMEVNPRAVYKPCLSFSGGNQQKIAMAKWLLTQSRVWLMFDPTRGIDVGTKHQIFVLMRAFAAAGGSVLFYSTDVPELVNVCDCVSVIYRGRNVAELEGDALTEEEVMRKMLSS
ncbi:sugar ABC transporter ATP-binding protein [Paraburkholderia nemoris]|uniref:Ribose import ATP-binding protein RbsA n=1 Tax=Paraburkholderia nemoris TaxID=2793076 RepID=A0ABN7L1Y4_9BURK|nr:MULTISPECIES: sugar ABC transporter ATP-binding protein [Paraburkholderia]MBK3810081.1 sugar ABC transporter ATP-binding protein [Paraburkholderia aspalathi]CAE6723329.1 Ribose import ATP-binding protein RbsA [Paraburkholderia nemoris]CAE6749741.1 Ribose import ATP-binding protein RbsA [Paraburkholderia nemoris]